MSKDKHTIRRLRREQLSAEFDANRGREGQIQPRINAKGEVELVAFFGGKWYYCPMAEFNKKLNMRHGAQVDGRDIMTSTQFDSSGFKNIRLDVGSSETPPKLNECKIFVDKVEATAAFTENCNMTNNDKTVLTTNTAGNAGIKVGLNVSGTNIYDGTFITSITSSGGTGPKNFEISVPAHGSATNQTFTFQTAHVEQPNVFFNILYKDAEGSYYHKFQLNTVAVTPFYDQAQQLVASGGGGGGGGSGSGSPL